MPSVAALAALAAAAATMAPLEAVPRPCAWREDRLPVVDAAAPLELLLASRACHVFSLFVAGWPACQGSTWRVAIIKGSGTKILYDCATTWVGSDFQRVKSKQKYK